MRPPALWLIMNVRMLPSVDGRAIGDITATSIGGLKFCGSATYFGTKLPKSMGTSCTLTPTARQ